MVVLILGYALTERALFVQKMGIILENEVSLDSNQIFMVNFNWAIPGSMSIKNFKNSPL